MKTLLSRFCEEFDAAVRPLLDPLAQFSESLGLVGRGNATGALPGFQEVSHQLRVLADKVAEQQAYVLIFGPLKSGKSTLMNSISAAYVSEVTALPAYPCMVYVSHSDRREFVVTRYNGDAQTFSGPASMRMQVNRDHAELADRIRRSEGEGKDFDPAVHFPEAIRRIDVRVPAPELAQSGAVLVDTPGLYSRMKFGYDRMTRDFRNSAACAIFVVKTDNLFLEQVFNEFNELLDLFSRIFLVINLDSTKMDLRPDGSLAPSLEREDPVRVIEAFETLAMNARLKRALEEGRLALFPVDLLRAASRRLQRGLAHDDPEAAGDSRDEFGAFLGALTDFLNSTDYLVAFLGDSLRRARTLLADAQGLCEHSGVGEIERRADTLGREAQLLEGRRNALARLGAEDWNDAFAEVERDLVARAADVGRKGAAAAQKEAAHAVDAWFEGGDSLHTLLEESLAPLLEGLQRDVSSDLMAALRERVSGSTAGALVPERSALDLDNLGLRLGDLSSTGLVAVMPSAYVQRARLGVDVAELPVRRGFVDWLLFRSRAAVRRGLLGPEARPNQPVSASDKRRRLGEPARAFLRGVVERQIAAFWPESAERIARKAFADYSGALLGALHERVGALRSQAEARLADLNRELASVQGIARQLRELRELLGAAGHDVERLDERYSETPPEALGRPVMDLDDGDLFRDSDANERPETRDDEITPQPRRVAAEEMPVAEESAADGRTAN